EQGLHFQPATVSPLSEQSHVLLTKTNVAAVEGVRRVRLQTIVNDVLCGMRPSSTATRRSCLSFDSIVDSNFAAHDQWLRPVAPNFEQCSSGVGNTTN